MTREKQQLQQHIRAIAQILYAELTFRPQMQEHVMSGVGVFLSKISLS